MVPLVAASPARRRRSAAEWKRLLGEWRASGESIEEFALKAGVRAKTLAWWSSELSRRARRPAGDAPRSTVSFLPVEVRRSAETTGGTVVVARIDVGAFAVHALTGASAADVAALCRALASETPC